MRSRPQQGGDPHGLVLVKQAKLLFRLFRHKSVCALQIEVCAHGSPQLTILADESEALLVLLALFLGVRCVCS